MEGRRVELAENRSWLVVARRFASGDTAGAYWRLIQGWCEERGIGESNFSVWRTTNSVETQHLVVLCGEARQLNRALEEVGVLGEPHLLDERSADAFAMRRLRTALEAEGKAISTRDHYGPDGMRLTEDGVLRPRRS